MRRPSRAALAFGAVTAAAVATAAVAAVRHRRGGGRMPHHRPGAGDEYVRIVEAITRGVLHAQRGEHDGDGGTRQHLRVAG
jgi:hypothetical protein